MKDSLCSDSVPESWRIYWTNSPLISWAVDLKRRVNFMRKAVESPKEIYSYDLSAFLNPHKFLTLITLSMASNYEEAKTLDQLDLVYEVKDKM